MYDATRMDVPTHQRKTMLWTRRFICFEILVHLIIPLSTSVAHRAKHRKAFKLEQLFNTDASYISCEVVGDADPAYP